MTLTTETGCVSRSLEITEVAKALCKAQDEFDTVKKGGKNPHFRSTYARIEDVISATTPVLTKHGLTLTQLVTGGERDSISLTSILMHTSGQFLSSQFKLFFKDACNPQAAGGAITYARRYAQLAILNLGAEDDDGNYAAQNQSVPAREVPRVVQGGQNAQTTVAPQASNLGAGDNEYIPTFGKFKGLKLSSIPTPDLESYVTYLQKPSADGKPMSRTAIEFIVAAKAQLLKNHQKDRELAASQPPMPEAPMFDEGDIPF